MMMMASERDIWEEPLVGGESPSSRGGNTDTTKIQNIMLVEWRAGAMNSNQSCSVLSSSLASIGSILFDEDLEDEEDKQEEENDDDTVEAIMREDQTDTASWRCKKHNKNNNIIIPKNKNKNVLMSEILAAAMEIVDHNNMSDDEFDDLEEESSAVLHSLSDEEDSCHHGFFSEEDSLRVIRRQQRGRMTAASSPPDHAAADPHHPHVRIDESEFEEDSFRLNQRRGLKTSSGARSRRNEKPMNDSSGTLDTAISTANEDDDDCWSVGTDMSAPLGTSINHYLSSGAGARTAY